MTRPTTALPIKGRSRPRMSFAATDFEVVSISMVGDQGRQADAEVDVIAVVQLWRGAGRHLVTGPAHESASRDRAA